MRGFGIAAALLVLASPALAQDGGYYREYNREAPQIQDDERWADDQWADGREDDRRPAPAPAAVRSEEQAVDACAVAAENQGREYAANARVVDITDVARDTRGWVVEGTVALRQSWRERAREERFRCAVTDQGLRDVRIDGLNNDER